MKPIKDLFGDYKIPTGKRTSRRALLIEYFTNKINKDRDGVKYRFLKWSNVNYRLSLFTIHDLEYIKSICDDYERRGGKWSKCFFGSIKVT